MMFGFVATTCFNIVHNSGSGSFDTSSPADRITPTAAGCPDAPSGSGIEVCGRDYGDRPSLHGTDYRSKTYQIQQLYNATH
jgi:hypothetical protein